MACSHSGHSLLIIDYYISAIAPCLSRQIFSPQLGLYVKRQTHEKPSIMPCCRARRQETRCVKTRFDRDELPFFSSSSEVSQIGEKHNRTLFWGGCLGLCQIRFQATFIGYFRMWDKKESQTYCN